MNRYAFPLVPLFVMVAGVAEAAESGDIRGRVLDPDGLPVPNATVTLSGPALSGELVATTNEDGRFAILQITTGTHDLMVSMGGFQSRSVKVTVK